MPEKIHDADRQLLRDFVTSLADLSDLTVVMMDKQLVFVRKLAKLGPKYQEASERASFWKNAIGGLGPEDVADLFFYLGRIAELGNELGKFGTLKPEEQDKLFADYKEATKALNYLKDKMKEK